MLSRSFYTRDGLRMRILYDHQITSLQDAGGISLFFYQLIRNLLKEPDVDITHLLGRFNSVIPFDSLSGPNYRVRGTRTHMKKGYLRYALNELLTSAPAAATGKFDIYHPTHFRNMLTVRSAAIVACHHDSILERYPETVGNAAARMAAKRRQFKQADAILCISESSRQDLHRFYDVPTEKSHVIHLGVTPFPEGSLPEKVHPPYLLYVGTRKLCKNFDSLIKAFAASRLHRDFTLVCAGGGAFTEEESRLIESERIADRVLLLPRVSNEELGALYRHAHAFVYPSLYEGFGLPPLEAMESGTIAVVSHVSSMPEVCGEGAIYFEPTSIESMVASLEQACYDEALRNEIRVKGKAVAARLTWEECARKTHELYRQIL
jgi:glycosyltransferase involved in cell wall biosynthesis